MLVKATRKPSALTTGGEGLASPVAAGDAADRLASSILPGQPVVEENVRHSKHPSCWPATRSVASLRKTTTRPSRLIVGSSETASAVVVRRAARMADQGEAPATRSKRKTS